MESEDPGHSRPRAEDITDDAVERMKGSAAAQRVRAAEGIEHAADAAHHAADRLRGEQAWLADLVDQGAGRLVDFAHGLRTRELSTLLTDAENFARRQPILFTGAAMALGFALTRVAATAATVDRPTSGEVA